MMYLQFHKAAMVQSLHPCLLLVRIPISDRVLSRSFYRSAIKHNGRRKLKRIPGDPGECLPETFDILKMKFCDPSVILKTNFVAKTI